MGDEEKTGWNKLLEQVTNPWDWAFGIIGAAAGAGITVATGGTDLFTSIPAGFTTGVGTRKLIVASTQKRQLRTRADAVTKALVSRVPQIPQLKELVEELDLERSLWEDGAISNDDFAKRMDSLINKFREIHEKKNKLLNPGN